MYRVYTLCWLAELSERFIHCVVGQNKGKGVYSVLVCKIEGMM